VNVLVIDVGGTHVKILATGQDEHREFVSGPTLTPQRMAAGVKKLARGWKYDVISMGYPGLVLRDRVVAEPHNLGKGWIHFDYRAAFGRPVKIVNDAAMQALGSYKGGKMLFLGLGTGLGSTMIVDGVIVPMELGHLPFRRATFEEYVGRAARQRLGPKRWRAAALETIQHLSAALLPDYVVLGGGLADELDDLPAGVRVGGNELAFVGGFRLWE